MDLTQVHFFLTLSTSDGGALFSLNSAPQSQHLRRFHACARLDPALSRELGSQAAGGGLQFAPEATKPTHNLQEQGGGGHKCSLSVLYVIYTPPPKPAISLYKPRTFAGSPAANGQPASGASGAGTFSTSAQTQSSPRAHRLKRPPPQSCDPP